MLPLQRKPDELLGEIGSVLSYMRLHRVPGMIEVYLAAQEVLANARNSEAVLALFHHLVEKDERTLTITVEGAEDLTTSIGMQRQQAVADLFSRTMKAAANCADRDSIERVYEVARDVGAVGMVPTPFWIEYIKMVAGISGIYPAFGVYGEMIKYATIQLHPGFFNHLFSRCGGSGLPHFALRLMQDMDFVDVEMSRESLHTVFQILTQNTGASLFAEKSLVTAILANNLEHAFELFRMTSAGHYGHPVDTVMVQYLVAGCMDSHQADRAVDFLVALAAKQLPGVGMERVTLPSVVCERALLSYCMKNKSPYVFADFLLRMAEVSPSYVPQLRLGVLIASVNEQTQHRIKNAYGRNFAILLR